MPSEPKAPREPKRKGKRGIDQEEWVGLDTEGATIEGKHRCILICAAGRNYKSSLRLPIKQAGVTKLCLDFILRIPEEYRIGGFCLNYDWTMILHDLPSELIWLLVHPDERKGEHGPVPIRWEGYSINYVGKGKVSIRKGDKRRTIWDVFSFFQGSFVNALEKWDVTSAEEIERIRQMKSQRSDFSTDQMPEIERYCLSECVLLALLVEKLNRAHVDAGIPLANWYGAGSTSAALLSNMGAKEILGGTPTEMEVPIWTAYFGGRSENSVIGPVDHAVYGWDISGAYPYAMTKLPCLCHGKWNLTDDVERARSAQMALIQYRWTQPSRRYWGPLPFRHANGNIVFPTYSGGGWVWNPEFWAAKRGWPEIEFVQAWVYETSCGCKPFEQLYDLYQKRLEWGKEGKGIVLKLGMNGCYGKLAQRVGAKTYHSMSYAGYITSHCRAQVLELIDLHKNERNVLAVATDGVYGLEPLRTPEPSRPEGAKPLGGWEGKVYDSMFFLQPGIYFCPKLQERLTRSRGVPRSHLEKQRDAILKAWYSGKKNFQVIGLTRFHGMKSSIGRKANKKGDGFEYKRSPHYGQWKAHPHELTYSAKPKRCEIESDNHLSPWILDSSATSQPYDSEMGSESGDELKAITRILEDQPEGNWEDMIGWGGS